MPRIRYEKYDRACSVVREIIMELNLDHIIPDRIYCVRSYNAKTRAVARIYGLPKPWMTAGLEPGYVIEFVSERFDKQNCHEKIKTIIHELLHIPSTFSGGLRPHGRIVNGRNVYRYYRRIKDRIEELCALL